MSVDRSDEFILAALFLSRCGVKREEGAPLPPAELGTTSWASAYAGFYDSLGAGRSLRSFHNSLKATRDQFDSHVVSGRRGWRDGDDPRPLPSRDSEILDEWREKGDDELWEAVRAFFDQSVAEVPRVVLRDLKAEPDDHECVEYGLDGKTHAVISRVRERSPSLRNAALRIHGYACQVCGFNFGAFYGEWGRGFAEVHHLVELSRVSDEGHLVNAESDLAVLCANCHRMVHRRPKRALRLDELREMVRRAGGSGSVLYVDDEPDSGLE